MALLKSRVKEFEIILNTDVISLPNLQTLCFNGIPDEGGFRSMCWKLLLNYLPLEATSRTTILQSQRSLYKQLIDEMISSPNGEEDHPLSVNPNSLWGSYFKDNEVLLQIDKDVRRLCPDISFFQSATEFPCDQVVNSSGDKRLHKRVENSPFKYETLEKKGLGLKKLTKCIVKSRVDTSDYFPMSEGNEAHWEVVERILFLYAKLNPGQGYVQGMNEIIGPIYHVFAVDPDASFREHAEADCFFCFTNLMSEIRDFFIKSLDEAEGGINQMMDRLEQAVHTYDEEVWKRLKELEIKPQYYSFRWLTLLLSQEFPLPDVERIWDSLFADKRRFDFLIHVCCAMIILLRDQIISSDFATIVKLLQNFPPMDVSLILSKAASIRDKKTINAFEL